MRANATAKRRLAHLLDAAQRQSLIRRCYEHVVETLQACGLEVITLCPHDLDVPRGVELLHDAGRGLNGSLDNALRSYGGRALVVHADLPWLDETDVQKVLGAPGEVVVARAHDGGTNGLLLGKHIRPAFGPNSAIRHATEARAAGLRVSVVDTPGFARDLDDEAALSAFSSSWPRRP